MMPRISAPGLTPAAILVLLVPVLALTTPFGTTLAQAIMLVAVLLQLPKVAAGASREQVRTAAWVTAGCTAYFLVSLARMITDHGRLGMIDGPSRLLLAISCVFFVLHFKPPAHWFWAGLCIGGVAVGLLALYQKLALGMERAEGFTHHPISFGDLAVALGLMAFCAASVFRRTRWAFAPVLALVCCLGASLLSGSRGGWLALLVAAPVLARYRGTLSRRLLAYASLLAIVLLAVAVAVPATGVASRLCLIVQEVRAYFEQGDFSTSIGIRLELWKASWLIFLDHPLFGAGRNQFEAALQALASQGRIAYSPALGYASSHNDALYFLATGGLVDFVCLLLLYLAPLAYFFSVLERRPPADAQAVSGRLCPKPAAVAGVLLVLSFMAFGLTDVMFWLMAPTEFYAVMVCLLIGFCLGAKDQDDK
ncbi:MAG TPA: O-antigen ligase family protein [Burkholderiaceae bacterium]